MLKTACRSLSRSPVLSGGLMQSYCRRGVDELGHFGSSHASQRGILFSYGGRIERLDLLLPDCRKSCGPLSPWTTPEVPGEGLGDRVLHRKLCGQPLPYRVDLQEIRRARRITLEIIGAEGESE